MFTDIQAAESDHRPHRTEENGTWAVGHINHTALDVEAHSLVSLGQALTGLILASHFETI